MREKGERFLWTNLHRRGTEGAALERESCARLRHEVWEAYAQKLGWSTARESGIPVAVFVSLFPKR